MAMGKLSSCPRRITETRSKLYETIDKTIEMKFGDEVVPPLSHRFYFQLNPTIWTYIWNTQHTTHFLMEEPITISLCQARWNWEYAHQMDYWICTKLSTLNKNTQFQHGQTVYWTYEVGEAENWETALMLENPSRASSNFFWSMMNMIIKDA
jgi:hypothetical protein